MEPSKKAPQYHIELLTDPACAKDVIKGILHAIFFHRTFTAIRPLTRDILDVTLPLVDDPDLETLIDSKATSAVRRLESALSAQRPQSIDSAASQLPIVPITIHFFERKRRKTYFSLLTANSAFEEIEWEVWVVKVAMVRARSEGEAERLQDRMETSLREAGMNVVMLAGGEKEHVPPITTSEGEPFPYRIGVGEIAS